MERFKRSPVRQRVRDLIVDVSIELSSRLSRTVLMVAAVAFSTGALLASVGISQNAARQVDADIAASTSRLVMISVAGSNGEDSEESDDASEESDGSATATNLPDDTVERLLELDNVEAVGLRLDVDSNAPAQSMVDYPVTGSMDVGVGVKAVSSGYFDASQIESTGNLQWMLDGSENVAYLGEGAARELGVPVASRTEAISLDLNGVNYSLIGFLPGSHALSNALVIPYSSGLQLVGQDKETDVLILTALGAGNQVSKVARLTVMPGTPEKLDVSQVVIHEDIRQSVSGQLTRQAAWIGGFLLVLTVLLIANSMIVSVTARTTEIGIRRALGASRSAVAGVFWFEGGLVGALGGLAGAGISTLTVMVIALLNDWTAHLNPAWVALGPLLGLAVGLGASLYPALRAAAVHPAIAVRSG